MMSELHTFHVEVIHHVVVKLDRTKFTDAVMSGFNECISNFGHGEEALCAHAHHIALRAVESFEFEGGHFAEGYGITNDAGIVVIVKDSDTEIVARGAL